MASDRCGLALPWSRRSLAIAWRRDRSIGRSPRKASAASKRPSARTSRGRTTSGAQRPDSTAHMADSTERRAGAASSSGSLAGSGSSPGRPGNHRHLSSAGSRRWRGLAADRSARSTRVRSDSSPAVTARSLVISTEQRQELPLNAGGRLRSGRDTQRTQQEILPTTAPLPRAGLRGRRDRRRRASHRPQSGSRRKRWTPRPHVMSRCSRSGGCGCADRCMSDNRWNRPTAQSEPSRL